MTDTSAGHVGPVDRFDRASTILAAYPDITNDELLELKRWFAKASALEVASIASTDALSPNYLRFKAEHLEKFTLKDWLFVIATILVICGSIAALGILAPG